jgi:hypothetical protein
MKVRHSSRLGSESLSQWAFPNTYPVLHHGIHSQCAIWPVCAIRDVLIRRDPRSNPERRSAESVFRSADSAQPPERANLAASSCPAKHPVWFDRETCGAAKDCRRWLHSLRPWRASASGGLLHGTGTPTADELARVNNQRPSIFSASPLRYTWLLAVQFGRPVAGFNDTSK